MQFPHSGPKHHTYQVSPQAIYIPHTHGGQHSTTIMVLQHTVGNVVLVMPDSKGSTKHLVKTCRSLQIQFHFKGSNIIWYLLGVPKIKDSILQKSGVIYRYKCTQVDCEEEYIKGIRKDLWRKAKRTPKGPLLHLPTQQGHRTSNQWGLLHHNRQGSHCTI